MAGNFSQYIKLWTLRDGGTWDDSHQRRIVDSVGRQRFGRWWCSTLLSVLICLSTSSFAVAGVAEEYQVKAAFFYHFARFIEWPAENFSSKDDSFRICIVGKNPFQGELEKILSGKKVHNRPFKLMTQMSDAKLLQCHVVFVGDVSSDRSHAVTRALQGKSVLTIGEGTDFIEQGGMIRLFVEHSKVRFGINPQAAQQVHLDISSKLLRLAKIEEP